MTASETYPWSAGFRTLSEEHDYRIDEIDGEVPPGLRGTLFRNGSGRNSSAASGSHTGSTATA